MCLCVCVCVVFFVQAEDGIRDLVRSRGLGDVYKRQIENRAGSLAAERGNALERPLAEVVGRRRHADAEAVKDQELSLIHI